MKRIFLFSVCIIIALFCFSCKEKALWTCRDDNKNLFMPEEGEFPNGCFGVMIDESAAFKVQSKKGEDLLNPNNPKSYKSENIKIYHVLSDCTELLYNPKGSDNTTGFSIFDTGDGYVIGVILSAIQDKELRAPKYATTYIQWNNKERDVINTEFIYRYGDMSDPWDGGNCDFYTWEKVYYNSKLILDGWKEYQKGLANGTKQIPVIVK